jgi:hypothetical protein
MEHITPYEALAAMRKLSEMDVTFSLSFMSYSKEKGNSDGVKHIKSALLAKGYRDDQSGLSHQLIAYIDCSFRIKQQRQFHLPLLLSFNNYKIKP